MEMFRCCGCTAHHCPLRGIGLGNCMVNRGRWDPSGRCLDNMWWENREENSCGSQQGRWMGNEPVQWTFLNDSLLGSDVSVSLNVPDKSLRKLHIAHYWFVGWQILSLWRLQRAKTFFPKVGGGRTAEFIVTQSGDYQRLGRGRKEEIKKKKKSNRKWLSVAGGRRTWYTPNVLHCAIKSVLKINTHKQKSMFFPSLIKRHSWKFWWH